MSNTFATAVGATILGVVLCAPSVQANTINFDIQVSVGNVLWGSGVVSATELGNSGNYLATAGSLQLAGGPYTPFNGTLVPNPNADGSPWNALVYGGTQFNGLDDQIVQTGPSTYGLDANGLLFNDPNFQTGPIIGNGLVIATWNNSPGAGNAEAAFNGYQNEPWFNKVLNLTVNVTPVPDGGTTAALLGFGIVGCALVSRKLRSEG